MLSCMDNVKQSGSEKVHVKGEFNNHKDLIKIGDWYFTDNNSGDTIKYGRYENGHKIKTWNYKINGDSFELVWHTFQNDIIAIDYPKEWRIKEMDKFLFYALKDSTKGYNITRTDIEKGHSILNYLENYIKKLHTLDLKDTDFRELTLQDSITVYRGNFTYKNKDSIDVSCITSIFEIDNTIYDCTYFSRYSSISDSKDFITQSEITYSLFIQGREVIKFPTLINSKKIKFNLN